MLIRHLVSVFAVAIPFGCAVSRDDSDAVPSADQWDSANNPARIGETFIYEVASLPVEGETQLPPLASDYWPSAEDSVNRRWDGTDTLSPAEKFELAFDRKGFAAAISEKLGTGSARNRPSCSTTDDCAPFGDGSVCVGAAKTKTCIPTWWGICHGISSAAVHEPALADSIVYNKVTFYRADIEALRGVLYAEGGVKSQALPGSCGSDAAKATNQRGEAVRPCHVTDAGAWHVLVTNMLGLRHRGFVYDRTTDLQVWNQPVEGRLKTSDVSKKADRFTGSEVWNQPADGFRITNAKDGHLAELSRQDAYKLIGPNSNTVASSLSKRFFDVEMDLWYPKTARASREPDKDDGTKATETVHFRYILETGEGDRILRGHWVTAKDGGGRPDFAWWPTSDPTKSAIDGLISYADIKALTALATDPKTLTETRVLLSDFSLTGDSKYLVIGAPEKTTVTITMTGKGDADLSVRAGAYPSATAFNCKSTGPTADETCTVTTGGSGASYYVRVNGTKGSTVTVAAMLVRSL